MGGGVGRVVVNINKTCARTVKQIEHFLGLSTAYQPNQHSDQYSIRQRLIHAARTTNAFSLDVIHG